MWYIFSELGIGFLRYSVKTNIPFYTKLFIGPSMGCHSPEKGYPGMLGPLGFHKRSRRCSFHSGYRTTVQGVSLKVFERFLIISIIFSRLTGNLIAFSGHRRKQLRQSKHKLPNLGSGSSTIAPAGHSLAQTLHREQSSLSSVFGVTGIGAPSFFFISAASSGFG
jgi:hypothetical protein